MKLVMLTCLAGIRHVFNRDDVIERDDAEGERLIDANIAARAPDDAVVTAWEHEPAASAPATSEVLAPPAVPPAKPVSAVPAKPTPAKPKPLAKPKA